MKLFLRIVTAVLCNAGFILNAPAQQNDEKNYLQPATGIRLRTNPLSFIEPEGHVLAGMEWRWNKSFSAGVDAAFIFYNPFVGAENSVPQNGFKIRPEFRYYFTQGRNKDWFVSGELNYKQVGYNKQSDVCVTRRNGICDYIQQVDYKEIKRAPGFSFKMGFQQFLGREQKLYYEIFLGAGFKHISRKYRFGALPPGVTAGQIISDNSKSIFEGNYEGTVPHLPAGIKLGIKL